MLSLLPDFADPVRLCGLGKVYEGTIPLAELPRLEPLLSSPGGEAAFVLAFSRDRERRSVVHVKVQATPVVQCQRCLGELAQKVDSESFLAVVSGPEEAEQLPKDLDPLLVIEERVALRGLIEDELILAIPPSPMHPADACGVDLEQVNDEPLAATENPDIEGKPHPFAALAALKERDQDTKD